MTEDPISQKKDLIGQENESYVYNGNIIEIFKFFIYEVSIHKYWKGGYCLLGNKLFKSNKALNISHFHRYKYFKECIIEKEISLIAAPYEFIREMNLPVYKKPIIKRRKKK